jgi:hypothetical protein
VSSTQKSGKSLMLWIICIVALVACAPSKTVSESPHANNISIAPQEVPTSTIIPQVVSPTTNPEQDSCKTIHAITICIQDIKRTDIDTQVKLKILVESNMVSGSGNSFIFPDDERGLYPVLLDTQGNSYSLKDNADNYWAQFDEVEWAYFQMLYFRPVSVDATKFTLSLPMVAVDSPLEAEGFQLDLGTDPQPGQTKALDITTTIDGQTFHFVKAEFEGDGVNSLPVTLYTDPLNLPDDIFSVTPIFGDHEKSIFFGAKQGINEQPLRAFADLVIPPGKSSGLTNNTYISGVLNLEVDRITYWYRGPFEITYKLP